MTEDCPVCSSQMTEHIDTIDWGGPICEHVATCPNGCYSYEFSYGYTTVFVNVRGHRLQFGWGYSDDKELLRAETDAIDTVCAAARAARLEDSK
jgi:hypothetical protein